MNMNLLGFSSLIFRLDRPESHSAVAVLIILRSSQSNLGCCGQLI